MGKSMWYILPGDDYRFANEFQNNSIVAIGFNKITPAMVEALGTPSQEKLKALLLKTYSEKDSPDDYYDEETGSARSGKDAGNFLNFVNISMGDYVLVNNISSHCLLLGRVCGEWKHDETICSNETGCYANYRKVDWISRSLTITVKRPPYQYVNKMKEDEAIEILDEFKVRHH